MEFYSFHLMPWPHVPPDFDDTTKYPSAWVTLSNEVYDPERGHELYNRYLDELELAEQLGFDGVGINEHHQNTYGTMPAPNVIAGMLARRTDRVRHGARHRRRVHVDRRQPDPLARAVPGGARPHRPGVDGARALLVRGEALSRPLREHVAAPPAEAASPHLDSRLREHGDHRVVRAPRPQVPLHGRLHARPPDQAVLRPVPQRRRAVRLYGVAEPARPRLTDLRGGDGRAGAE